MEGLPDLSGRGQGVALEGQAGAVQDRIAAAGSRSLRVATYHHAGSTAKGAGRGRPRTHFRSIRSSLLFAGAHESESQRDVILGEEPDPKARDM